MIFAWSGGVWHVAGPGSVVGRQRVRDGRDRVRQVPEMPQFIICFCWPIF